jgi:hypothetical protein
VSTQTQTAAAATVESEPKPVGAHPRFVALAALGALVAGLGFAGRGAYQAATDAWMAPINLSPDNDAVIQINVKLNEQIVARDKLKADIERFDGDLAAIDIATKSLASIRDDGEAAVKWSFNATGAQSAALTERVRSLRTQRGLLADMVARQAGVVERGRKNANAGLTSNAEVERDVQVLDELKVAATQNERDAAEARSQLAQLTLAKSALKDASEKRPSSNVTGQGLLPEIAAGQERAFRVRIELVKLESERRSLVAQRAIAADSLERMGEVFKQLKSRPLYRAVQASTDVAFIPYTQLEGVQAGAEIVSCKWVLFRCQVVGRVAEVLPGEVVAQDPWSDVARGQYAILELSDHQASKEKVLRARKTR